MKGVKAQTIPIYFLIILLLILQNIGCSDSDVKRFQDITLDLVTMDSVGKPKNVFNQNENIVFVVQATNESDEVVELGSTWDFCHLPNSDNEYLLVYQRKSSVKVPIGRPFAIPINCLDINLPIRISPNSTQIVSGGKWFDNPNNKPLNPGIYNSSFDISIDGQSFRSEVTFVVE